MNYYGQLNLDHLKHLIDAEVRQGVQSLRASYLSKKYGIDLALVQGVLSDLVAAGDLTTHYQLLCSGQKQRFDVDREFATWEDIPRREVQCHRCGDHYVPSDDNIILSFEPTKSYLEELSRRI